MAEYKDAQAVITEITKVCDDCWHVQRIGGCPRDCFIKYAVKAVESVPAADVVPVVRCKGCKHNPLETWFDCPLAHLKYDGERWCWKGERKDGEQHGTK